MSWQTYVDDNLMREIEGGGKLKAAAIVGHDGSVLAQSTNFPKFNTEEIKHILIEFNDPGHLVPTGIFLGGTKYIVIEGEFGAIIRGKKGSGGIIIKKTNKALLFGIYDEPVVAGQCNLILDRLGNHLIDQDL